MPPKGKKSINKKPAKRVRINDTYEDDGDGVNKRNTIVVKDDDNDIVDNEDTDTTDTTETTATTPKIKKDSDDDENIVSGEDAETEEGREKEVDDADDEDAEVGENDDDPDQDEDVIEEDEEREAYNSEEDYNTEKDEDKKDDEEGEEGGEAADDEEEVASQGREVAAKEDPDEVDADVVDAPPEEGEDFADDGCVYSHVKKKKTQDIDEFIDAGDEEVEEEQNENTIIYVPKDERITRPVMTKYEANRIVGTRIQQLNLGAKACIKNVKSRNKEDVAKLELKQKPPVLPFYIERELPDGRRERWDLEELEIYLT